MARMLAAALSLTLSLGGLTGCGGGGGESGTPAAGAGAVLDTLTGGDSSEATGADYTQPAEVLISEATSDGIDTSHASEGYVSAAATSSARLKFQVMQGDIAYNYDLPNDGTPTVFPLNMGNGSYLVRIMQNTSENNYVEYDSANVDVSLSSDFAPFLVPSVFCNYNASSACVAKARELTSDATNEGEVVKAICNYVAQHVSYDDAKAEQLSTSTGYVPDPDSTLSSGKGVCFDYASLSAAMLRSMGIPTKVVTGYVGEDALYHAWIMVYIDGTWESVSFKVSPNTWSRCDVTFASAGATQYVGDASSYEDKYVY